MQNCIFKKNHFWTKNAKNIRPNVFLLNIFIIKCHDCRKGFTEMRSLMEDNAIINRHLIRVPLFRDLPKKNAALIWILSKTGLSPPPQIFGSFGTLFQKSKPQ